MPSRSDGLAGLGREDGEQIVLECGVADCLVWCTASPVVPVGTGDPGVRLDAGCEPFRVEVEVLDPHPVRLRSHRDKSDVDSFDLYDTGVRRGERVEESLSHTVRVVAPQALEIGTHDHRSELGHPGGVGEDARSKAPLRFHVESLTASQSQGSTMSIPIERPRLPKQTGPFQKYSGSHVEAKLHHVSSLRKHDVHTHLGGADQRSRPRTRWPVDLVLDGYRLGLATESSTRNDHGLAPVANRQRAAVVLWTDGHLVQVVQTVA